MSPIELQQEFFLLQKVVFTNTAYTYQNWLEAALPPSRNRGVGFGRVSGKELAMDAREGESMNKKETKKERIRQIKKLLDSSTPEQQKRIKAGRKTGRRLRKQVERL